MSRLEITSGNLTPHNDLFWEHFTDHLMMVLSFLVLGFLLTVKLCTYLIEHRIKIDYDLPKGKIIRVIHNGKAYYVGSPNGMITFIDILLMLIFSRNTSPIYIQEKKRIRRISKIILAILILSSIWGVIMLFSALERDINPFNHIELIFSLFE